jgi:hypothetical protein
MKASARLYLNLVTLSLNVSGVLFCALTKLYIIAALNALCIFWVLRYFDQLADFLDSMEDLLKEVK